MPPRRPSVPHRLGPPQMAFVRCWAEGIDPLVAWRQFMQAEGPGDMQRARATLRRLIDELRGLARAHGRPDIAALLRRDPQAIVDTAPGPPTLDEFRAQMPPDFYSEAELTALYEAEHGRSPVRSAARRRQRLRERLVLALQWLERHAARAPLPTDPTAQWLDDRLAQRLRTVGLHTLADLGAWMARHGAQWHRPIARVGPRAAERVQQWWQANDATLGPLPPQASAAAAQPQRAVPAGASCPGLAPLERFVAPPGLDGAAGTNRSAPGRCRIAADTDAQALGAWLAEHAAVRATWRAYRKEAERFLLWAVLERGKPLSSIDGEDCRAYRAFLAAPPPAWCGPRGALRAGAQWRPFEGPLSARSAATALAIVGCLCAWLVRQRYLAVNPWHDEPPGPAPAAASPAPPLRAFSAAQWERVQRWLDDPAGRAPTPATHRLRFTVALAYATGLRLSELAQARLGWLRPVAPVRDAGGRAPVDGGAWVLRVPGAGGASRDLPLPDALMGALADYLERRGLQRDPRANPPQSPLIARLRLNAPLSPVHLYAVLAQAFGECARAVGRDDPATAERIGRGTARWLRHTHGAHALAQGVPQSVLQARLGHRSAQATAVYATAGTAGWRDAGPAAPGGAGEGAALRPGGVPPRAG